MAVNYRINSGALASNHWMHDPEFGGGRIIGEVCHFVDLIMFLVNSPIKCVSANIMKDANNLKDTAIINLSFENGSIGSISYFSNGNKILPKERIEIFSAGQVAIIEDFKEMKVYGKKEKKYSLSKQDKGHRAEVETFLNAIKNGHQIPIPFHDIYLTTLTTFKILESVRNQKMIQI